MVFADGRYITVAKHAPGLAGRTMKFSTGFGWTRLPLLAAAFIFGSALTVSAQIIAPTPAAPDDEAAEAAEAPDVNDPDVLKGIDIDKLDWSQLAVDAGTGIDPSLRRSVPRPPPRRAWTGRPTPMQMAPRR
ncbi:conserved protein of unknown function [Bradyrhizobium vignae]|uniref:Uncharacterized protein n=1 Tax=Bradyrhizobium vignae TaxID=1549949 RepID=A0A2U3PT47_9BRAD|nr:conserved protein of unknown function [Bradyrhizobium vignae]